MFTIHFATFTDTHGAFSCTAQATDINAARIIWDTLNTSAVIQMLSTRP